MVKEKTIRKTKKEAVEKIVKFAPAKVEIAAKKSILVEAEKNKIAPKETKISWKNVAMVIGAVLLVILLSSTAYFYSKYKKSIAVQNDETITKIGNLMVLPLDEKPTVATVTDKTKVNNQPFFAHAENDDKVVIYPKSQKAILFRPSIGKLIEVMNISVENKNSTQNTDQAKAAQDSPKQENQDAQAQATKTPENIKVAVYNGSNVKGLAGTLADKLASMEGLEIAEKTNASSSYPQTIVVNLTDKDAAEIQKIADAVGGQVGDLPTMEIKPSADVLIIAGKDYKGN